jgi:hypothetical protein
MTSVPNGLAARKPYSTHSNGKQPERSTEHLHHHENAHEHDHNNANHSHSIFSAHSHSHGEEGHDASAEEVMKALGGSGQWNLSANGIQLTLRPGDRGSRITLIGLFANIGLTASKGAAGWYMNSAALLAEAGHSLSGAWLSSLITSEE